MYCYTVINYGKYHLVTIARTSTLVHYHPGQVTVLIFKDGTHRFLLHALHNGYLWYGNAFHITGPLCRESTGPQWIPSQRASDAQLWRFLWSQPEQTNEQTVERQVNWNLLTLIVSEHSTEGFQVSTPHGGALGLRHFRSTVPPQASRLMEDNNLRFDKRPAHLWLWHEMFLTSHIMAETKWLPFSKMTFSYPLFLHENVWISIRILL